MAVDDATLLQMAQKLRRHSLESTAEAGSGHPTSCMSCAEIVSVLFFDEMRFDPRDPERQATRTCSCSRRATPRRSCGPCSRRRAPSTTTCSTPAPARQPARGPSHAALALGARGHRLARARASARRRAWPGRASWTSSGGRVYALLGDGEAAEGSVWEAAQFASFYELDNLCAIVDVNRLGQSGPTMYQHDTARLRGAASRAFGWDAVDGRRPRRGRACARRFARGARRRRASRSRSWPARFKGKGVSFLEDKEGWHGKPVKKGEELQKARGRAGRHERDDHGRAAPLPVDHAPQRPPRAALHARRTSSARRSPRARPTAPRSPSWPRPRPQVVAIDGDTKNSTFSERFKEVGPERFAEAYIAEQNMVGAALGMSTEGKIPFASTFACFLTRAYDFIRMAAVLAAVAPGARAAATRASPSARTARRRWRSRTWP